MDIGDASQRSGEKLENTVPTSTDRLSERWQIDRRAGSEALWTLRADLDRSLSMYYLGRYNEVIEAVRELIIKLDKVTTAESTGVEEVETAQLHLIYAAAYTLLGQTHERLGQNEEARA